MARPTKLGLDYFPHDTHTDEDTALQLLEAEFGLDGYAVYFKLLESIYAQGYAKQWGEDECLLFAKKMGAVNVPKLSEIIKGCIRRSLFDEGVYNLFQILTSKAIQLRWLEAKRKDVSAIDPKVCLIEQTAKGVSSPRKNDKNEEKGVFTAKTLVNTAKTLVNTETTPQSKVKYSNSSNSNNARETKRKKEAAQGALNLEPLQPVGSTRTGATIREVLTSNQIWSQAICSNHRISPETFNEYVTKFEQHCFIENRTHNTDGDVQVHFNNWLRIQLNIQANNKPSKQSNNGTSKNYRPSADDNRRRQEERTANIERRLQEAIYDTSDIPAGSY
ncbi:MAG: DUF4373 domain-containing protein [Alloprevotella sp.]|nr:MAG: DUF4373 domain-containing protein [Alloprevotella sp.]